MTRQALKTSCQFETIGAEDLLSAVKTLSFSTSEYAIHRPHGAGFETFLRWAAADIELAAKVTEGEGRMRHSTNAVMNARRALSCMVDQYLLRDGFAFCKDAPNDAQGKAQILKRRGILDPLGLDVLDRAIQKRHMVEHRYQALELGDAQDVVHVIRATADSVTRRVSPYNGPCVYGSLPHGFYMGPDGSSAWFSGWSDALVVFTIFESKPWVGVILPTSQTDALVRRCALAEMTTDDLLGLLAELEKRCKACSGGISARLWRDVAKAAGLSG